MQAQRRTVVYLLLRPSSSRLASGPNGRAEFAHGDFYRE